MPCALVNGTQIYYELHGPADAEVLVLSNGILMSTASWALQVPDFSRFFRVLLYDARGMWQSDHPQGPYTFETHADDLATLLNALNIKQAHIAGISYGGEISQVFAYRHPEKTRSLILSSTVSEVDEPLRQRAASWFDAARAKSADMLFEATTPLNFTPEWIASHQPLLEAARKRYASLDFDAFLRLMDCFIGLNITPELRRITAPTLVMVGERDLLKPRRYAEIITREISQAELAVLPNAGHAASWDQANLWNTLVLGFATKHSRK